MCVCEPVGVPAPGADMWSQQPITPPSRSATAASKRQSEGETTTQRKAHTRRGRGRLDPGNADTGTDCHPEGSRGIGWWDVPLFPPPPNLQRQQNNMTAIKQISRLKLCSALCYTKISRLGGGHSTVYGRQVEGMLTGLCWSSNHLSPRPASLSDTLLPSLLPLTRSGVTAVSPVAWRPKEGTCPGQRAL